MSRILITGASGYLGNVFLSNIPRDWKIIALDIINPNIDLPPRVSFVKGSITDEFLVSELLKDIDIVLHLAAIKGSSQCQANPRKTIEINIGGTHILLKNAILNQVKKFIFASTYWVYGNKVSLPYKEDSIIRPHELYGLSKAVSEIEIINSGLDYLILRFSNIFGMTKERDSKEVIFNFIKSAFETNTVVLHGGGKQRLDFIDIEDVNKYMTKIINNRRISRCVLNVGSGQPTSIAEAARIICDIFKNEYKKRISILKQPLKSKEISDKWVSTVNLEKRIGRLKLKPLKLSIESYIKSYKEKVL